MNRRGLLLVGAMALSHQPRAIATTSGGHDGKAVFQVAQVTVPIVGMTEVFAVRRIYCIGSANFAGHVLVMGTDPTRPRPFFFQKPTDAIQPIAPQRVIDHPYPGLTKDYQCEVSLVVALKSGGSNIRPVDAQEHIFGYAIGLDMSRRDLQRAMSEDKKPWDIGKSFDRSAPLGPIHPAEMTGHYKYGEISLAVNGAVRQRSDLSRMIWKVNEQISQLSEAYELAAGDLIFCGTPEQGGAVQRGELITAKIRDLADVTIKIV